MSWRTKKTEQDVYSAKSERLKGIREKAMQRSLKCQKLKFASWRRLLTVRTRRERLQCSFLSSKLSDKEVDLYGAPFVYPTLCNVFLHI